MGRLLAVPRARVARLKAGRGQGQGVSTQVDDVTTEDRHRDWVTPGYGGDGGRGGGDDDADWPSFLPYLGYVTIAMVSSSSSIKCSRRSHSASFPQNLNSNI